VTVAPFENTLHLRIYNIQGNELYSGPLMVQASEPGAAGTFSATLDLSSFAPGRVIVELSDLSAADGSVNALDAILVAVR
jgi:hypothetical protein